MPDILAPDAWRRPWSMPLAPYERPTGDRRVFDMGALSHRDLPLPLMLQVVTAEGHKGAVGVGRILGIEQTDDGPVGHGDWFSPAEVPEVRRALALAAGRAVRPSVDLEPDMVVSVDEQASDGKPVTRYHQARIVGATLVYKPAFDGPGLTLGPLPDEEEPADDEEYGSFALTGTQSWRSLPVAPREAPFNADQAIKRIFEWAGGNEARVKAMHLWMDPNAAEGTRDRYRLPVGDIVNGRPMLFFHAIYAAAALVSGAHGGLPTVSDTEKARLRETISAAYKRMAGVFGDPALEAPWDKRAKMPDTAGLGEDELAEAALTAAAVPVAPPAEWFTDPGLPGPSPVTIDCDGRVRGHLATWGTCHRSVGQMTGSCVTPPRSKMDYALFRNGSVLTADGSQVRVGKITVGTGHPPGPGGMRLDAIQAAAHYDNTGTCVAIVAAGEDDHGIWVAGSLVPEATPEQVALLRRSPLSGDWRRSPETGSLELVAALGVNVPGFPILATSGGGRFALIASGLEPGAGTDGSGGDDVVTSGAIESAPAQEPVAAPTVDVDEVARRAADILAGQRRAEERLATIAAAVEHDRRQRLQRIGGVL